MRSSAAAELPESSVPLPHVPEDTVLYAVDDPLLQGLFSRTPEAEEILLDEMAA